MHFCSNIPFVDLGFTQQDENLWIRYTNEKKSLPHFAITTTINPVSMTFLVKDLIDNKMFSTNSYDDLKNFVITSLREYNLKNILG